MKKLLAVLALCVACLADWNSFADIQKECKSKDKDACEILAKFEKLKKECQNRDKQSCDVLASLTDTLYSKNTGDKSEAYGVYDLACLYGSSRACFKAYMMFKMGDGIDKDPYYANVFILTDCNNGNKESCGLVGDDFNTQEFGQALQAFNQAEALYWGEYSKVSTGAINNELIQTGMKVAEMYSQACNSGKWKRACAYHARTMIVNGLVMKQVPSLKDGGEKSQDLGKRELELLCKNDSKLACDMLKEFKNNGILKK